MAFTQEGQQLATGCRDAHVRLCDLQAGALRLDFIASSEPISALAYSPGGNRLASGSADTSLLLWDMATRSPVLRLELGSRVAHLDFTRDGRRLIVDTAQKHLLVLDSMPR